MTFLEKKDSYIFMTNHLREKNILHHEYTKQTKYQIIADTLTINKDEYSTFFYWEVKKNRQ